VLVQMFRALFVTGFSSVVIITLILAFIPILLGIWALRISVHPPSDPKWIDSHWESSVFSDCYSGQALLSGR